MNAGFSATLPAVGATVRKIERNRPLGALTTFRAGGAADNFCEPNTLSELSGALALADARGWAVRILGFGANLIVADEGVRGLVISMRRFRQMVVQGSTITVDAGVLLPALVNEAAKCGLAGLAGLAGIPATVGGAIAMNAGGRHGETADSLASVTVVSADGRIGRLAREEVGFGYRHSGLDGLTVVRATFVLGRGEPDQLRGRSSEIAAEKKAVQPYTVPSAGCTFANPDGQQLGAGRMIDLCGLRGMRIGGAEISQQHANFIVNRGGATAADWHALAEAAREAVLKQFGVELRYEVRRWAA